MPKGWVPNIVGKASSLHDVWVEATQSIDQIALLLIEFLGQTPTNLCNLKTVRQTGVQEKTSGSRGHLRDAQESLEGGRIQNDISVFLKERPIVALSGTGILMEPGLEIL
jgi:hypothetical protein